VKQGEEKVDSVQQENKVVAISGGFDPPHNNHYHYIEEALKLGNFLLIILTRDDQLIKKKGKVWITYEERKYMLDFLLKGKGKEYRIVPNIDSNLTSRESILEYQPIHIFAKGGDTWDLNNLPEREICEKIGTKVIFGVGGFKKDKGSSDIKDEERENL
jgi:cytidyltransferase-like protein